MIYLVFTFQIIILSCLLYGYYMIYNYKKNNFIARKFIKTKITYGKKTIYQWLELDCVLPIDYYKKNGLLKDNIKYSISHNNGNNDGFFPVNHFSEYEAYEFSKDNKLIAFYNKAKNIKE